jgi:hypothetical protein
MKANYIFCLMNHFSLKQFKVIVVGISNKIQLCTFISQNFHLPYTVAAICKFIVKSTLQLNSHIFI